MPKLSKSSKEKLDTCCKELQHIIYMSISEIDFKVLEGHRDKETQDRYFEEGKSKVKFPDGKHNSNPSDAIDIAPYPIDWDDTQRFVFLAGVIKGVAHTLGYKIRWGGDWDGDNDFSDQSFNDLVHFEIVRD